MKKFVDLEDRATQDILDSIEWYELRQPGLGDRYLAAVEATKELISTQPEIGKQYNGPIKRWPMQDWPFSFFYVNEPEIVNILAVFPEKADPADLEERLS